jgi:hypothetical protein
VVVARDGIEPPPPTISLFGENQQTGGRDLCGVSLYTESVQEAGISAGFSIIGAERMGPED